MMLSVAQCILAFVLLFCTSSVVVVRAIKISDEVLSDYAEPLIEALHTVGGGTGSGMGSLMERFVFLADKGNTVAALEMLNSIKERLERGTDLFNRVEQLQFLSVFEVLMIPIVEVQDVFAPAVSVSPLVEEPILVDLTPPIETAIAVWAYHNIYKKHPLVDQNEAIDLVVDACVCAAEEVLGGNTCATGTRKKRHHQRTLQQGSISDADKQTLAKAMQNELGLFSDARESGENSRYQLTRSLRLLLLHQAVLEASSIFAQNRTAT